jgi:hypothetical protein
VNGPYLGHWNRLSLCHPHTSRRHRRPIYEADRTSESRSRHGLLRVVTKRTLSDDPLWL